MSDEFSTLKLVDVALTNARTAGCELDQNTIAVIWRIASGKASDREVSSWKTEMASKIDAAVRVVPAECASQFAAIDAELRLLQKNVQALFLPTLAGSRSPDSTTCC